MFNLVHINKIEFVRVEELLPLVLLDDVSCRFKREPFFFELDLWELVGVTIEDSYENNQKIYTTTAVFSTRCKEPLTDNRLAFRVTSVSGMQYLIGTNERPYPVIKEKNPYPEKPADSTLKSVTITWKAKYPMLRIVE